MANFNSVKKVCLIFLTSAFFSHLAYAKNDTKTLNFAFIYGSGVNSVSYDNPVLSEDGSSSGGTLGTPLSTKDSYTISITTQINSEGSIATDFNNNLSNNGNLALELGSTNEQLPSTLDFFSKGGFSINGHPVTGTLYLAHNSKDNNNWWIGSNDGTRYNPNPVEIGNMGMDFHTTDDPNNIQYFCLKQDSSANYEVIVVAGKCNQTDWSDLKTVTFDFVPQGSGSTKEVTSVSFVYNNISQTRDDLHNNIDFFQSLTDNDYSAGNRVQVTSKLAADESIATSFNQLGANQQLSLADKYTSDKPNTLYFLVTGSLYINGGLVTNDLTLAMSSTKDGGQWWIGSSDGTKTNDEKLSFPDPSNKNRTYCLITTNTPYIIDVNLC